MTSPTPAYAQSLDFLQRWAPQGPWILTAIQPDTKSITTRTFRPEEKIDLVSWITIHGVDRNIYFSVNPTVRPVDKKAERTDIAALAWLHVDVDPRPREDLRAEQVRALSLLQNPPGGIPPPTAIVFSGGGYQGFWRLREPFAIDGDLSKAEEAKRWNLQLELVFGGDSCHNVDRIMRLPGTVNWPNAKKRGKGRVPALASVVLWEHDRVYDLSQFTPAPLLQGADDSGINNDTVQVSGNIVRLASLDELPAQVSPACKVAINLGKDPDEPDKYPSRSEWLFFVCCSLVRAGCSDDTIYSVITDPDFKISESVLDKGTLADSYARRQIKRAREEAVHPRLRELNEKHAVIGDIGGKCRILSEVPESIGGKLRSRITYMSFADFTNRYCNQRVDYINGNGNPVSTALGKWWVHHPLRAQFDTIVFAPGREVQGAYNLWKGFAFDARPGGSCEKYLAHIRENICSGVEEHYNYVLNWMALCVQQPDSPGHTAIVLRGPRGTGKSFFAKTFGSLFGRHFMHISDPKHLVGSFNAHLQDCVVLFADEAFYAGDRKHEGMLKMLVTEETLTVEKKGVDAMTASNFVHLIMASNDDWVVPAGFDERRFFVLDVSETYKQRADYFAAINKEMQQGGYEALLHHLMTHQIKSFQVRAMPQTKALQDQKILSLSTEQEWWFAKLMCGEVIEGQGWPGHVYATHLVFDFTHYARLWNTTQRSNSTRLGRFLRTVFPYGHRLRAQLSGTYDVISERGEIKRVYRPHVYCLPDLAVCRLHWDQYFGGPYDWPEPELVDLDKPVSLNTTSF